MSLVFKNWCERKLWKFLSEFYLIWELTECDLKFIILNYVELDVRVSVYHIKESYVPTFAVKCVCYKSDNPICRSGNCYLKINIAEIRL